jgi:hypothetical protein
MYTAMMPLWSSVLVIWIVTARLASADVRTGLVYAPRLVMRDDTERLAYRIEEQISRSISLPNAEYSGFESYWAMRDRVIDVGPELSALTRYGNENYTVAQKALFDTLRRHRISHVLRVEAYRPAKDRLSIRLDLYKVPRSDKESWEHARAKWVAPCGVPDEQAIDELAQAARCITDHNCDSEPSAEIDAIPSKTVPVNEDVTLDGCASHDADEDALQWEWQRYDGAAVVARTSGRRWTLRFRSPGEYVFKLVVREELSPQNSAAQIIHVRATTQPIARAGPSQRLDTGEQGGAVIALDATGSENAETYLWEQLSGPIGSFGTALTCSEAKCSFQAPFSGAYVFRLVVRSGPFSASDQVTVLVNPSVDVHIDRLGIQRMFPRHSVKLRAIASANQLDKELLYRWSVSTSSGFNEATLDAPTASETRFTPIDPGNYMIRLTTSGRKIIGERELWTTGVATTSIRVDNPESFLYIDVAGRFPAGADQVHTTFVPMLHFIGVFGPEASIGARYSVGVGAEDLSRGPTFDLQGSFDVVYRSVVQANLQGFAHVGYFGARHDARGVVEHGFEVGWINAFAPLSRWMPFLEFSLRYAFGPDDHVLFGVSLGLGRAIDSGN